MDDDKNPRDDQEDATQISDETIGTDMDQSTETDGENRGEKVEFNENEVKAIEKSQNHEGSNLPFEPEIKAVEPDTTAVKDLIEAMGIRFWKPQKKAASIPEENLKKGVKELPEVTLEEYQKLVDCEIPKNPTDASEEEIVKDGIDMALEPPEGMEQLPVKKTFNRKLLFIPFIILILFLGYRAYGFITEPKPPSEEVVAAFSGKNLTKDDLLTFIRSKGYKEEEHGLCKKHGFDHSKCDKTEECETHPIHSMEAYKQIIKMIATQKIVNDWAKEKGITQKDEVKHDFKHLVEEVSLENLVDKVHTDQLSPDKIDKLEIQRYYDANKDKYKDKPFSEVEGEIRNILAGEKDNQFFPAYIEKLKKNAGLDVNYDILKVDNPTETEMRSFYEKNKEKYIEPKKVKIQEIKVDISASEEEARKMTEEALTKLRGGESFEGVAKKYSSSNQFEAYYVLQGEKGENFEDKVLGLQVNEISSAFKDNNSFHIVKVLEKQEKRQKTFGEVLKEVKAGVLNEKEDKQYELRKNEALFSVHGKRFTLGEFKEEFKELSPETQAKVSGFEAKKSLIDQFIVKELLLEESGDDAADANKEDSKELEELKSQYISQILHKEEIDEKMGEITDAEAKKFYEEKKKLLVDPPKAKISLIRVELGKSEAESTRARQRIDEALEKLKSGTEFATIAKAYSTDSTASIGGELKDWIYDDDHLEGVLKENIFKLRPNEISDIFEYEGGYYVIKLHKKEDKKQKTFEEVKEQLKEALFNERHLEKEEGLGDELLKKSQFVIYESSLRKMLKEQTKTKN